VRPITIRQFSNVQDHVRRGLHVVTEVVQQFAPSAPTERIRVCDGYV